MYIYIYASMPPKQGNWNSASFLPRPSVWKTSLIHVAFWRVPRHEINKACLKGLSQRRFTENKTFQVPSTFLSLESPSGPSTWQWAIQKLLIRVSVRRFNRGHRDALPQGQAWDKQSKSTKRMRIWPAYGLSLVQKWRSKYPGNKLDLASRNPTWMAEKSLFFLLTTCGNVICTALNRPFLLGQIMQGYPTQWHATPMISSRCSPGATIFEPLRRRPRGGSPSGAKEGQRGQESPWRRTNRFQGIANGIEIQNIIWI